MDFDTIYNQVKGLNGWMDSNDCKVLYDCVKDTQGLIVEIGAYAGISTKVMALAAPNSKVITIDSYTHLNPPDNSINFTEIENDFRAAVEGLNVTLLKEDSSSVGRTWDQPIDFLHIDGDHSYEKVLSDINFFVPWLKPGQYVLFHDYSNDATGYGVRKAVDELKEKYFDEVTIIEGFAYCRRNQVQEIKKPLLKGSKVLVLGGAGFIGSVLVDYLREKGDEVVIFDNYSYGQASVNLDIQNINQLVPAIEQADAIVNLAGLSNDPLADLKPELTWSMNYKANDVIADLLKSSGKRIVYASSCSVYGFDADREFSEFNALAPVTLYARTKMLSETLYLQKDINSIILRFATVYGYSPSLRLDLVVNTMIATSYFNKQIAVSGGGQWRPVVHVKDVAQAIYRALHSLNNQYQIYNVGSNEQNYQIATLGKLIHQNLPISDVKLIINDSSVDKRSYKVNFDRIDRDLNFQTKFTVKDAITELYEKFKDGTIKDMNEDVYFRVKYLKKTLL